MLKFDEKFLYGIPEMDSEHRELIQRAEDLINAYQNNDPETEILRLLAFLKDYVETHFAHEEELQKKYKYPDFDNHHKIHEDFKYQIHDLYERVQYEGLNFQNRLEINHICSEWIAHHIGEEDKKLAHHILSSS